MVLNRQQREVSTDEALDRSVVEVKQADIHARRQFVAIDGVAMVLRRNVDAAVSEVLYRVVRTSVAKL